MTDNKRRFQRIPFEADAVLTPSDAQKSAIAGVLQDISLKGALISVDEGNQLPGVGLQGSLKIHPDQAEFDLNLTVEVAYALEDSGLYGINILSLDVDSAGHLRRLIEFNLGSDSSLQRELSSLIEAMEAEHQHEA